MHNEGNLKQVKSIVKKYHEEGGKRLNYDNFHALCIELFGADEVQENEESVRNIFDRFYLAKTDGVNEEEWQRLYEKWLYTVLNPVNILLVIDMQNDFIDGTIALRNSSCGNGVDIIEPINRLVKKGHWDKIIYSLDWHPENHISFFDNLHMRNLHPECNITKDKAKPFDTVIFLEPHLEQKLWPRHCVMNTWGSELHKDLLIAPESDQVRKGQNPNKESYSVFSDNNVEGTSELVTILTKIQATDVYVCGLAYEVCVKETCLDGLRLGYRLALLEDCCRGISHDDISNAERLIIDSGGLITNSDKALSLIEKKERSVLMAHQAAKFLLQEHNNSSKSHTNGISAE